MRINLLCSFFVITLESVLLIGCDILDFGGESGSLPEAKVMEVHDLGVLETNSMIRGRDVGYSAVFDGRSVWLYGDTILNKKDENEQTWHNNSWSWTTDLDASDGIGDFHERSDATGAPTEFFPVTAEEKTFNEAHRGDNCSEEPCRARWALWPGAIITDSEGNRALIFYAKLFVEPGDFNFKSVGHSIAVWNFFENLPERPIFRAGQEYPTLFFDEDEPAFGSAAFVEGSTLYVYGCDLQGFAKPCRLARVPLSDVLDRNAWTFYAGEGNWFKEVKEAIAVFNGNDIMSVSYNSYLKRFLAVYSKPLSTAVMLRTSPRPEGPWSESVTIFNAEAPKSNNGWIYDALSHLEYSEENGRVIYVTYSRATDFLASEVRLVSVRLEKP